MFNQEEIKSIANQSPTSKIVFNNLSKRLRFRRGTNLSKFHVQLINAGEKIVEDEYMDTFKKLQTLGVGSLIFGRGGKPNRFKWNYNLKDVAKAAFSAQKVEMVELQRKPGRPVKVVEKRAISPKVDTKPSKVSITLEISSNSRPEDITALLDLAKQLR